MCSLNMGERSVIRSRTQGEHIWKSKGNFIRLKKRQMGARGAAGGTGRRIILSRGSGLHKMHTPAPIG